MNNRSFGGPSRLLAIGSLMAGSLAIGVAAPAAAECTGYYAFPAFERFAINRADQVLVGEVTEEIRRNSADGIIGFRFRVDEALVGPDPGEVSFEPIKGYIADPGANGCAPTVMVSVGDRLAIALDEVTSTTPASQVGVAAFLDRDPTKGRLGFLMRGAERLSLSEVRALLDPPASDAETAIGDPTAADPGLMIVMLSAVLGGILAFPRFGRRFRALG